MAYHLRFRALLWTEVLFLAGFQSALAQEFLPGPVGRGPNQPVTITAPPHIAREERQQFQYHLPQAPVTAGVADSMAKKAAASEQLLSTTSEIPGIPITTNPTPDANLSFQFNLPPWIQQIARTVGGISAFLSSIGLPGVPEVRVCGGAPIAKEVMLCIMNAMEDVKPIFLTAKEISVLNTRVASGGRTADMSLARLKSLASKPYARLLMKVLGTTSVALFLMQRESTPDRQRWQAGSIVTLITDLPIVSDVADSATGGFGHVNVVLPRPSRIQRADREIKKLKQGVDPIDLGSGGMGVEGRDDTGFLVRS